MRLTVGSGNTRQRFQLPNPRVRVIGKDGKYEVMDTKENKTQRERAAEDIKNFLFRPKLLAAKAG